MNNPVKSIYLFFMVWLMFTAVQAFATENYSKHRLSENNIQTFDFKDADLGDVLKVFSALTGKNVTGTPEVLKLKITLYLKSIPTLPALETLCKIYNLWYVEEQGIIRIMKMEEYARELILRRDEKTRIFNLKFASCLTVAEMISCIFGDRVEYEEPDDVESYGHVGTDDFPDIGETDSDSGSDNKRYGSNQRRCRRITEINKIIKIE